MSRREKVYESRPLAAIEIRIYAGLFAGFLVDLIMASDVEKSPEFDRLLTDEELAAALERHREGMHLQEIEGNPLDAEDVAMFEMFHRERWSHEKCRACHR